jgi:bifunctional DNA-binding transcriptional regulator/antitoxin component of YhaV-PrlF toxin-antitoxin module
MGQQVTQVSVRGQTVIPQALREALGIRAGTRLAWSAAGGSLIVTPETANPVRALRGILRGRGPTTDALLESRRQERRREQQADDRARRS